MRIVLIIIILINTHNAWSCTCLDFEAGSKSNIENEIEQSDWIGIGTIVDVDKESYPVLYQVEIRIAYKGSSQVKTIETGIGGPDCGFIFEIGEEYIIYGNLTEESRIITSICRRTNKIFDSADYDYLNKKFKDINKKIDWSESFSNFFQKKINARIDLINPPIIIDKDYQYITIEQVIEQHPNYYLLEPLKFNSDELERMNPRFREIATKNGIVLLKPYDHKTRKRKVIRKLNKRS